MTDDARTSAAISRRQLLHVTAAVAITTMIPARSMAADGDTIRIMGVETAALEDWAPYTQETGLKVAFTGINSDPGVFRQEVVANSAGDSVDIFLMDGGIEDELGPKGFFMPIDGSKIEGWSTIPENMRMSPLLMAGDAVYGIPAVLNADSFAYDRTLFDDKEPLSFALLFESEATKGKVGLENTWLTTLPMAANYLKVAKGCRNCRSRQHVAGRGQSRGRLFNRAKEGRPVQGIVESFDQSVDMMARKEAVVSNVWEPAVEALQKKGMNIGYATTREGYNKWLIGAFVPETSQGAWDRGACLQGPGGIAWGSLFRADRNPPGLCDRSSGTWARLRQGTQSSGRSDCRDRGQHREGGEGSLLHPCSGRMPAPTHVTEIEAEWERFRQA